METSSNCFLPPTELNKASVKTFALSSIEDKAKVFTDALFNSVGGRKQFDEVSIQLHRTDKENPNSNEEAMASLLVSVKSKDQNLVGRLFSAKIIELVQLFLR